MVEVEWHVVLPSPSPDAAVMRRARMLRMVLGMNFIIAVAVELLS